MIRKSVEDQTAAIREQNEVLRGAVAHLDRIEKHLAYQSAWMARHEHPAVDQG